MNSYRIVLTGKGETSERTGFVFCSSDERVRAAAEKLLRNSACYSSASAYDGERLVCEIQRESLDSGDRE